jgi:hypothetical protein
MQFLRSSIFGLLSVFYSEREAYCIFSSLTKHGMNTMSQKINTHTPDLSAINNIITGAVRTSEMEATLRSFDAEP